MSLINLDLHWYWNVQVQTTGYNNESQKQIQHVDLGQQLISKIVHQGQVLEISTHLRYPGKKCGNLHRVRDSRSPRATPQLLFCNILLLHVLQGERDYENIYLKGTDCLKRPTCNPINNWNYIFITTRQVIQANPRSSPLTDLLIGDRVRGVMRNGLLFISGGADPLYLSRDKWKTFEPNPESLKATGLIPGIKDQAEKSLKDYELEKFFIVSPYPLQFNFLKEYSWSILRGEKVRNPSVLAAQRIIERVNGTPVFPSGPPAGPNGLIGALKSFKNAIAISLAVNEERWEVIEFSKLFSMSYVLFIIRTPRPAPKSLSFLLEPFEGIVWLGLGTSIFLLFVISLLIISHRPLRKRSRSSRSARNASSLTKFIKRWRGSTAFMARTLILPLVDQSTSLWGLRGNTPLQFVFGVWILSGIVFGNLYRSKLVSFLVQPAYTNPPRTFKELVSSGYSMRLSAGFSSISIFDLKRDLKIMTGVDLEFRILESNESQRMKCFTDVAIGDHVCIEYDFLVDITARLVLTDEEGRELFLRSRDRLLPTLSGFPISPTCDIKPTADKVISSLEQSGLMNKWMMITKDLTSSKGRKNARATSKAPADPLQLVSLKVFVYPIFLLAAGCLAALVIFIYESCHILPTTAVTRF